MAGEIRQKMAALRAAKEQLVADMGKEIDGVMAQVHAARADGIEALKLPKAELDSYKQEIQEIRDEFAPHTNGAPPGPLPGSGAASPAPSAGSQPSPTNLAPAAPPSAPGTPQQPQASWRGQ